LIDWTSRLCKLGFLDTTFLVSSHIFGYLGDICFALKKIVDMHVRFFPILANIFRESFHLKGKG
jgi:hypothetical protein